MPELVRAVANERASFKNTLDRVFSTWPTNADLAAIKKEERVALAESSEIRIIWKKCQHLAALVDRIATNPKIQHDPEAFRVLIERVKNAVDEIHEDTQVITQREPQGPRAHFMHFVVTRIAPAYSYASAFINGTFTEEELFAHLPEIKKSLVG